MKIRIMAALFIGAAALFSQPLQQVQIQADCIQPFDSVTAVASSASFSNKQAGCNVWQAQYASSGFGTVSLTVQSALDSNGVPGAFGTIAGTVTQGTNPMTNTGGASNLITTFGTAFAPWTRVTWSNTGAGRITGVLLGFRQLGSAGTSATGAVTASITAPIGQTTSAASVAVVMPNDQISGCTKQTPVNLSGSGNTLIVTGVAAQNIYICDMEFSTGVAEDFKLTEGTGATCNVGTADATALMKNITAWSLTPGSGIMAARITATAGDSLCANQSVAQAAGVTIWTIIR